MRGSGWERQGEVGVEKFQTPVGEWHVLVTQGINSIVSLVNADTLNK